MSKWINRKWVSGKLLQASLYHFIIKLMNGNEKLKQRFYNFALEVIRFISICPAH